MRKNTKLKWVGLTLAGLGAVVTNAASAHMQAESTGGLKVHDADNGHYWFKVGGLIQLDEVIFMGKNKDKQGNYSSGANARRVRMDLNGGIGEHLNYWLEVDFSGTPRVQRALVNYTGFDLGHRINVAVGQSKPYWGLEGSTADGATWFIERSLMAGTFNPSYGLGIFADTSFNDMFNIQVSAYQPDANSPAASSSLLPAGKSDRWAVNGRITFAPQHTDEQTVHLGVSARHQALAATNPADGSALLTTFASVPEAVTRNNSQPALLGIDSGSIAGYNPANNQLRFSAYQQYGVEAAAAFGPAAIQAEYFNGRFVRKWATQGKVKASGWHVQAGYMLTGENRVYHTQSGTFGNPKPATECGAWEVLGRYSFANLNDKDIRGGREHNGTLGLNYFVNDNFRVAANWIHQRIHSKLDLSARKIDTLALRFQAMW
ncbi:MAG: phosphate-selective porin [Francisellaceae bacterium]|nr:phosphate-selective porin [Francisellaceae bacterium]